MRKLALILLAATLIGAAFYFYRPFTAPLLPKMLGEPASSPLAASLKSDSAPLPPVAKPKTDSVRPEFLQFLRTEAKSLDSKNVDTEAAGLRTQEAARAMGPEELLFARDSVLTQTGSAGERIMAVFLLTSAGERGWPALKDIVLEPLKNERVEPHTEAELKSMQEKSFRYMPIDALAEQAVKSAKARRELESWLLSEKDRGLANYLQKKLDDLPPL